MMGFGVRQGRLSPVIQWHHRRRAGVRRNATPPLGHPHEQRSQNRPTIALPNNINRGALTKSGNFFSCPRCRVFSHAPGDYGGKVFILQEIEERTSVISKYGHKITMAATGQSLGDAPVSGHCNPDLPPNAALGVPKNSKIPDTATEWVSGGYPQKPQCHSSSFDPVSPSAQMFARLPGRDVSRM